MKNFKYTLLAMAAIIASFAMSACNDDPITNEPDDEPQEGVVAEVTISEVTPNGAVLSVQTRQISEFAYIQRDTEIPASAILQAGEKITIAETEELTTKEVLIQGLEPNTPYIVHFAFRQADGIILDKKTSIEFTTSNYGDNVVTVKERKYDGFSIYLQIPEEVKERGNALRYSTSSLAMYNYIRSYYGSIEPDMLLYNAGQYTTKDREIIYDSYYSYERDEDGNIVENGAEYSDPKVPGEPGVFLVGEYAFTDDTEDPMYPGGWEPGYYQALFDWDKWYEESTTDNYDYTNKRYWTGYFERYDILSREPEVLESGVTIEISDKTPIDACITIIPSDEIIQYCVLVCTDSEWENSYFPLIDNNEEYIRWFIGSYFAMMSCGAQTFQGESNIWLGSGTSPWFVDTKGMAGQTIKVFVAGLGDGEGKIQSLDVATFTLPEVTLPKPEVIVTAIESDDPYSATFNIKNPNYTTNPIMQAKFACNYEREYNAILKSYSYTELIYQMGYSLGKNEIDAINTEAGFNFKVDSRDNETTRLAVLAYNWEGSSNNPDAKGSPAVAEVTTPHAVFAERVESALFDKLVGEWEATAPMTKFVAVTDDEGNATGEYKKQSVGNYNTAVSISAGIEYPEVLPESVYDTFEAAGYNREKTDAYYDEFKKIAKEYNARTRGFNRLLCTGYNFADKEYMLDIVCTPYDLFTAKDYSASKVSYMFYDFGPKWNLEIDKDGNVWLPINIEMEYPLEAFNFGLDYTFYMLAVGESSYLGAPVYKEDGTLLLDSRFPVEVSSDYNTITIKPIIYNYKDSKGNDAVETYYPCVAQLQNGFATPLNPRIAGDVVLTRKGAAAAKKANTNASVGECMTKSVVSLGEAPTPMQRKYSMTPMDVTKMKKFATLDREPIEAGEEAFHKRAKAYVNSVYGM